jgi:hypothetical protein
MQLFSFVVSDQVLDFFQSFRRQFGHRVESMFNLLLESFGWKNLGDKAGLDSNNVYLGIARKGKIFFRLFRNPTGI